MNTQEIATLVTKFVGDTSNYVSAINVAINATKGIYSSVTEVAAGIKTLHSGLTKFAGATLGVLNSFFGVTTSLKGAFNSFIEMEKALIGLSTAVGMHTKDVEGTVASYQKLIGVLERTTLVSRMTLVKLFEQAEGFGYTGEKAKQFVQYAVALGKGEDSMALGMSRVSQMLMQGNAQFARRILGLQGIKNQTELLKKVQDRLNLNMEVAQKKAESTAGTLERFGRIFGQLNRDIGEIVATYLAPVIQWIQRIIDAFKALPPETKKTVAAVVAIGVALVSLKPTLVLLGFLLAPLITAFGVVGTVLGIVFSKAGLVVIAIGAITAAILYWTGVGGQVIDWFTDQWNGLVKEIKPVIEGVKNAILAGDLKLAWEIVWTEIKIAWASATKDLKLTWIVFKAWFKENTADLGAFLVSTWEKSVDATAKVLTSLYVAIGKMTQAEKEAIDASIAQDTGKYLQNIEAWRKKATEEAKATGAKEIEALNKELEALKNKKQQLLDEAREKAQAALQIKPPPIPKLPPGKIDIKIIPKFDVAAFGSAEALTRIAEFKEKLQAQLQIEGPTNEVKKFDAAAGGGAEANTRVGQQVDILKEIRDILKGGEDKDKGRPKIDIAPADLG